MYEQKRNNNKRRFNKNNRELLENTGITYWLDGGWGVDILAGKQTRNHRDIDINFDAQHMEKIVRCTLKYRL